MGLKDLEKFLADKKEEKVAVSTIDWKQEKLRWLLENVTSLNPSPTY